MLLPVKNEALRALVCGLSEQSRQKRVFMILQSYIDDSGNDTRSPAFVLAGYLATVDQWDAFSIEWQSVLDIQDPRPLKKMRMNDAVQLRKSRSPFYGFTEDERDRRLQKFALVPGRHAQHGIISVIPKDSYRRIFKEKFGIEQLDRPYFLSFFGVMANFANIVDKLTLGNKVEFIFDTEDREDKGLLMKEFEKFVSCAPDRIKSIISGFPQFKRDDDMLPLQAADMLAWHARRYYYELEQGLDPKLQRSNPYFAHLCEPKHDIIDVWTEERLLAAADALLSNSEKQLIRASPYWAWSAKADLKID